MRKKIVAGNWKMNKTLKEAHNLTAEVMSLVALEGAPLAKIILGVPFPYLAQIKSQLGTGSTIAMAAQNCSNHEWGAYTGEVSAPMLRSIGIPFVILGHSERRQYFGENAKLLSMKINAVLTNELTPIFCCGEVLEIREKGTHEALVKQQVEESLFHLSEDDLLKVVVAYEPVWAIGTGKTASSQQAQEMHAVIRRHIAGKYGKPVAEEISILYGGSVKADNAKELFSCPDVDGGLVGGASLKAREFVDIVKAV
jgi:triosephosphate isomerase